MGTGRLWALSQLPETGQGLPSEGDQTLVRAAGPWGKKRGPGGGSGPRFPWGFPEIPMLRNLGT